MLTMTCNLCGKKYKDKMMDGSVCPKCGHIFKLYDDNDRKWYCEYCGHGCSKTLFVCPVCGHGRNDSPR